MKPSHLIAAAALAVATSAIPGMRAAAQTATMSPPPGELGGKQPMSNAASNIIPGGSHTNWAPSLPTPAVDDNAPPSAFLRAAEGAIAANHTGEAQEALERAESRALDRTVRPSKASQPSGQPLVHQIALARQALGNGDRMKALSLIKQALANPDASAAD